MTNETRQVTAAEAGNWEARMALRWFEVNREEYTEGRGGSKVDPISTAAHAPRVSFITGNNSALGANSCSMLKANAPRKAGRWQGIKRAIQSETFSDPVS